MKIPSEDQLGMAIMWLRSNEGQEGGEAEACKAVAAWIEYEEGRRHLRSMARQAGVPMSQVHEMIRRRAGL